MVTNIMDKFLETESMRISNEDDKIISLENSLIQSYGIERTKELVIEAMHSQMLIKPIGCIYKFETT